MPDASPASALAVEQPVRVRLLCAHGRVRRVDAAWRRLPVEQLWMGRQAQTIEPVLSRILTVCLQAHLGAAQQAVRAALRAPPEPPAPDGDTLPAIDTRIRLEAARDTLRRWLLDYPRVFGGVWNQNALRAWQGINGTAALAAYCRMYVFGMKPDAWLALDEPALSVWIKTGAALPARWLRSGLFEPLRRTLLPPSVNLLEWATAHAHELLHGGMPTPAPPHAQSDTVPSQRNLPSALLLHRLRRLAQACSDTAMRTHGGLRNADIGIGWARTARGLLLHLARVEQGRVSAYRILPPTLWNTAPGGILASALTGLESAEAERSAQQLLLLLDPCAPFEITLAQETLPPAENTGGVGHA
ncbi:MAG: HupK protein [Burkholderiaceae bacterium]|nr:HupK protein [Burkholderiaceae bacterium]